MLDEVDLQEFLSRVRGVAGRPSKRTLRLLARQLHDFVRSLCSSLKKWTSVV
jgi:hypothetical protein